MKKGWLFYLAALLMSVQVRAQGVGAEAGISLNNMRMAYDGHTATTGFKPAVRAGIFAQERITDRFSFQYGVYYNAKGSTVSFNTYSDNKGTATESEITGYVRADYIEIPLAMVYHHRLHNNDSWFAGAGPYAGLAFGGIVALDEEVSTAGQRQKGFSVLVPASIGNHSDDDFRMLDVGAAVFMGYELSSGFFGKLSASYGLVDIHPSPYFTMRNYNFALTAGYRIR